MRRALILAVLVVGCGGGETGLVAPIPDDREGEGVVGGWVRSGGRVRTYELFRPTDSETPGQLLIVLHGSGDTGAGVRSYTGFDEAAESAGYIVAYPDGLSGSWAAGCNCTQADQTGIDDVRFFRTLVDQLAGEIPFDRTRVFVVGFSQGSMMAQRLACDAPDLIAGFAGVGAGLTHALDGACTPARPTPAALLHGLADPLVPWGGDARFLSAPESANRWAARNGCGLAHRTRLPDLEDDGTAVWLDTYGGCSAELRFYGIEGGGHTWPGSTSEFASSFGLKSRDISATDTILDFFEEVES